MVDYARPGMVHQKMIWRWQALRRVGVMLSAPSQQGCKRKQKTKSNDNAAVMGSAGSAMKLNMAVGVRGAVVGWPPRVCRATMCCNRW